MVTKVCKICEIDKNISEFGTYLDCRNNKIYFKSKCKACYNKSNRDFYNENKGEILSKRDPIKVKNNNDTYYKKNKKYILEQKKEYNKKNKAVLSDKRKVYYNENKTEIIFKNSEYKKNKRNIINKRNKERKKLDPKFRLQETVRSVIKSAFRRNGGYKNGISSLKYLPYSFSELKQHIEKQFEPWMNWLNWGVYNSKMWKDDDQSTWVWQLDHIIPQSDLFYISMEDENFKKCWALDNLRPLSAKQNIIDGPSRIRHKGNI
ncbi:hypothetical protein UFOVP1290_25 [uncultured Caudovirales phage]|uniref:HNHc domain containing protein n=1 Tax=uncultured Caudovirales phage TaxID=2100421 RepID=A0A6J5RW83_9CAUD|nr:hypothetical protein UFOVP1290_25 [uncultured Caudovirales phage]